MGDISWQLLLSKGSNILLLQLPDMCVSDCFQIKYLRIKVGWEIGSSFGDVNMSLYSQHLRK